MPTPLQLFYICAASWTSWAFLRWLTKRSPLDNIPGPPSQSIWKGNLTQLLDKNGWAFHQHIANTYGSIVRINGICGAKQLYVFDPKALHQILIKDQKVYELTPVFFEAVRAVWGMGLFGTLGDQHRKQRKMLNPVFSINHMRHMLPIFYGVAGKLRDAVASQVANGTVEIDILHWTTRTTLELIGQGGLGYSFDPLIKDSVNPYVNDIKRLGPALFRLSIPRQFFPFIVKITSAKFRKVVMNLLPWEALHELRDTTNALQQMSSEVIEAKRSALRRGDHAVLEQIGQGKDVMSVLLKANTEAVEEDRLTEDELLGQVATFIFAGMESTSSTIARTLQILAAHHGAQERLRKEIVDARQSGGDLSHDELVALPYLDAVCREILRLYSPVPILFRSNRKDAILPLSKPIRGVDGKDINEITVPKNTTVIIGITALNHNPEIWGEDVLEWKPERWLTSLPESVSEARVPGVYSNMMTFLGGGRACIGFKFALLEIKVVLSLLIESFSFSPTEKDIVWNMGAQWRPSVKGSMDAQLPLRVSKLL